MSAGPHPLRERGIDLLAGLVGFPSVSLSPNGDIVGYIEEWLGAHGIASQRDAHEDSKRFNLLARIGPEAGGGILLSGHLDVVPADAAGWQSDPFSLRRADGRLYGRGEG